MASDDGSYLTLESPSSRRAWIEIPLPTMQEMLHPSPSSRRAWIEITRTVGGMPTRRSPSSRRAWIEIRMMGWLKSKLRVALLAEGVDRNLVFRGIDCKGGRRPPRGGRG